MLSALNFGIDSMNLILGQNEDKKSDIILMSISRINAFNHSIICAFR